MNPLSYIALSLLLILSSYLVFRVQVRRDYERRGKLSAVSSLLEFLVFGLHANLSYAFLPAGWPGLPTLPSIGLHSAVGLGVLAVGIVATLWSMSGLGFGKALGREAGGLHRSGFYRYSRNPQIVAYGLVIIGVAFLWPSLYGLGWVLIYGAVGHMMIRTEEEHLGRVFGAEYKRYCEEVPRYLPWPAR